MRDVRRIGRRTWLARIGGGLVALWAGLDFGRGQQGWGIWLGSRARAQQAPPAESAPAGAIIPVQMTVESPAGGTVPVAAFVLVRGREVAIVDSLLPDNADRIGQAIQIAGLGWDAVRHVILTHYHFDHAGSADAIAALAPSATFWAGPLDIPEIALSRAIHPANDGDEVFGLQILATPGHTPGHVSVLDPTTGSLFTGDAVFNVENELAPLLPDFTDNAAQALASVGKLAGLRFERLLFAHGPAIERDGPALLRELVAAGWQPTPAHQRLAAALRACCA
jgi:glyoxylase-like metal-dependent hydrolase (beta-lactamase superfamily II)